LRGGDGGVEQDRGGVEGVRERETHTITHTPVRRLILYTGGRASVSPTTTITCFIFFSCREINLADERGKKISHSRV